MKKITKWMIAAGLLLGAGVTSVSAFAASDNGQYNQNTPRQSQQMMTNEERRTYLQERVNQGDLTQEEAGERLDWMENNRGTCHDGTTSWGMMNRRMNSGNMGQHHKRMMGW